MRKSVNIQEAAEILGVSSATVKNWMKHEYISPLSNSKKILFDDRQVKLLRQKILDGKISRLNRRANKNNSSKVFIPKEYFWEKDIQIHLNAISEIIRRRSVDISTSIFISALNLFIKEKLAADKTTRELISFRSRDYKNQFILITFKEFYYEYVNSIKKIINAGELFDYDMPQAADILGLIYQSIRSEGEKAQKGSYYTPSNVAGDIVNDYIKKEFKILDPCCGTGQFLLTASNKVSSPENLFGFDIDPAAVFISKLNLMLKHKTNDFMPNIFQGNFLLNSAAAGPDKKLKFDLIITNPPWGLHFSKNEAAKLKREYPEINSGESFSYFMIRSLELIKNNGILSFILPESILNIRTHRGIRKIIFERTKIKKVVKLGRVFTNVFTNVIRMDMQACPVKQKAKASHANPDYIINVDLAKRDKKIIAKVYEQNYVTLRDNASWALGIVTGDNEKFIHSSPGRGFEKVITGKDINKFVLSEAKYYIKFNPDKFQQTAPANMYRSDKKLIYKFISDKLVFAYDDKQHLTLNSANILIPRIENYNILGVLGLLNSSLYQFLYSKKFSALKVLRGNLEELPFPLLNQTQHDKLTELVNYILRQNYGFEELDDYVFTLFGIKGKEKEYIINN